jgi:hypothetical protein
VICLAVPVAAKYSTLDRIIDRSALNPFPPLNIPLVIWLIIRLIISSLVDSGTDWRISGEKGTKLVRLLHISKADHGGFPLTFGLRLPSPEPQHLVPWLDSDEKRRILACPKCLLRLRADIPYGPSSNILSSSASIANESGLMVWLWETNLENQHQPEDCILTHPSGSVLLQIQVP